MRNAFTCRYNGRALRLITDVDICLPFDQEEVDKSNLDLKKYKAIWDTGAMNSCITTKVIDELGLKATGVTRVIHAGGESVANTFLVNIVLPDDVMIRQVNVTEVSLLSPSDKEVYPPQVLIGMDIISLGDFAVSDKEGKTTLSFRFPHKEEIDFVPEAAAYNIVKTGSRKDRRKFGAIQRKHGWS